MQKIEPHPNFHGYTEQQIRAALDDPDPANPIAQEVARLVNGYTENFRAHCERLGRIPEAILYLKGRWPIETIAMQLTTDTIRAEVARHLADNHK